MPVIKNLVDVITMKSDRPMRRLLAYYGILAVIVLILVSFFPDVIRRVSAKGLGDVSGGPQVLTDALNAPAPTASSIFGPGTLADLAVTTVLILVGVLALMLPVTWVYMSA
ncbi:MAG: hypothetical protein DMD30_07345, partial [Gemmatimonadetes bacterium]